MKTSSVPKPMQATTENPWWVSPNHLKEWDKCPKQFYYKTVLGQRWLSNERNFELGKAVHALMDLEAKGLPYEHVLKTLSPNIQAHFNALQADSIAQAPIVASEYAFYVPFQATIFPHVKLTGRIDRLSMVDNTLSIIDWKTGTAVPQDYQNAWQTRLYAYALWQILTHQPNLLQNLLSSAPAWKPSQGLAFYYVDVRLNRQPHVKAYRVAIDEGYIRETEALVSQRLNAILAETQFPLPKACPDQYCPFSKVCGILPETAEQLALFALPQASVLESRAEEEENPLDLF